ncbi:MAG: LysM peptidoglycan-binding domain-containing protein [Firmicutes bacterium]|nr:LysM peptidoglycan-binding domain-containing protein [Bacillota bacterium]
MAFIHVVSTGDTLWGIAQKYQTSVEELKMANGLTNDLIYLGQELIIPLDSTEEPIETVPTATLPSVEGGFVLPEGSYTPADLDDIALLARLVFAEARGEPFLGQIAVAAVLLNRVKHPEFPNTVRAAIYQPRQFEVVSNGTINQTPNNLAYLAVLEALNGEDPTDGSLFFWNPRKVPSSSWVWTRPVKLQIGEHVFA